MAHNATANDIPSAEKISLFQILIGMAPKDGSGVSALTTVAVVILALVLLVFLKHLVFPTFDAREPPVLRPRMPVIGHIVSMLREKANWHARLFAESSMPICTLPMMNGKMYVINSPSLITAAMRNTDISFDPFLLEFSAGIIGMTTKHIRIMEPEPTMKSLMHAIHSGLMGDPLHRMNVAALENLALTLNGIKPGAALAVADSFLWLRELMTVATLTALFGQKNPIAPEHVHLMWEFEKGVALLAFGHVPGLLAPESFAARKHLNQLLKPYYANRYDERSDVSMLIQKRSEILRREGFDDDDLAIIELTLPWVGTTNTIPTLFWLFVHLFSNPEFVKRVRDEAEQLVSIQVGEAGQVATMAVTNIDKRCPVLLGVYREVLRKYVHQVGNRRVMKDSTIKDTNGREYLLKKGTTVQWATSVTHELDSVWGHDAESFNPERFIETTAQEDKGRRGANIPFGGGRNLCPGRSFALAENLGFVLALALGFEVEGVQVPESETPAMGTARGDRFGDPRIEVSQSVGGEVGRK
ncbi:hypothetical protein ACHAQH_008157 [Verticillium albo-atrum]